MNAAPSDTLLSLLVRETTRPTANTLVRVRDALLALPTCEAIGCTDAATLKAGRRCSCDAHVLPGAKAKPVANADVIRVLHAWLSN